MSELQVEERSVPLPRGPRVPLGRVDVPVRFGDQVITSMLFNHDANPVHHKPDHAVQWMLGLLSAAGIGGEGGLAQAGPEERAYTLGARLLQEQDVVVMPGIILAAMCYERFVPPEDLSVSITTTLTYPLLVPTKGDVHIQVEGFELRGEPSPGTAGSAPGASRQILVEAFGPSLHGAPTRLLRLEALVYPAGASPEAVFEHAVAREFENLEKLATRKPGWPALSHASAISEEDRRRFARIVGLDRRITPSAWQAKIPRVLTEMIDVLRGHAGYQQEVQAYHEGRSGESERREAIARYVAQELKYRHLEERDAEARVNELAGLTQQLYARQYTVFDPRFFVPGGPATKGSTPFVLDVHLYETRLRRGIHRFYTGARLEKRPVFMGEATVTGQPLVTKELANFLCEINHSFASLKLFDYHLRR